MARFLGLVVFAGILMSSQTSADEAISITVRPAVATYRGSAQLKVLVARDDKNRSLVWEVDGPSYYRSSELQLNGAASPRSFVFMMRELPAGEFEIRATVKRNDRTSVTDRSSITVIGGPIEPS